MAQKDKGQQLLYHGAFQLLRKQTLSHKLSTKLRSAIRKNNATQDVLHTVRYRCEVETDWIDAIEEGLPHIDAAIREDRQFIRQEGEILPIERAKRVSRSSVEHLSRHSNLITHLPEEGEKLIPDKLYVVENLSNYAIYENKFLYMALRYVNDFLVSHIDAIERAFCRYRAELSLQKNAVVGQRTLSCRVELREEAKLDEDVEYDPATAAAIERMHAALHFVSVLLATPLMQELAKVPLLSPPITKTNILRMNVHFKAAVDLYEYLSAYSGDGYRVEEIKTSAAPFSEETGDEIAEIVMLCSYLTYKHGGFAEELAAAYLAEQEKERLREIEESQRRLEELRRRVHEHGESPEAYMLLLERQNAALCADSEALKVLQVEHEILEENLRASLEAGEDLRKVIEKLEKKLGFSEADLQTARTSAAEELAKMRERAQLQADTVKKLEAALDEARASAAQFEKAAAEAQAKIPSTLERSGKSEYRDLFYMMRARYNALRHKVGMKDATEDFTTPEAIEELEQEFASFNKFFDDEWKKTKQKIRKEYLWTLKAPKEKKGGKKASTGTGAATPPAASSGGQPAGKGTASAEKDKKDN